MAEGFTQVPNNLIRNEELNVNEKVLLIYFLSIGNKVYPSYKKICEVLKCSKPTAIKTVQSLSNKGYIAVNKTKTNGDFDNNSYTVIYDFDVVNNFDNVVKEIDNGSKKSLQQVVKKIDSKNTNKRILSKEIYMDLKFIDDVVDKVKITQEEYNKLVDKFTKSVVHKNIIALDNYIANGKGNKYKDHYRVLNTWCGKSNSGSKNTSDRKEIEDIIL
ncbi:helix-turn-helix domain-containing protein [Clostridium sp. 19966]|uniref:helix-turn-helix domain-containing protein n=1 Tax=Clostridium sp. 19966 TaxID=2768166 RepID=UPI0028DDD4E6|nr:helix-turn-helix domain-containing protein [Clostridium sp. 19966]MDT8715555.1 helix-turn-helix domain-containing protein [Clostridium sp. 19966]